jgi:prevent-host-death family protein
MPIIRPISDLRNHADQISDIWHKWREPVFITKNGKEALVVMSQSYYDREFAMNDLYHKLQEAEVSLRKNPKGISHRTLMKELRAKLKR